MAMFLPFIEGAAEIAADYWGASEAAEAGLTWAEMGETMPTALKGGLGIGAITGSVAGSSLYSQYKGKKNHNLNPTMPYNDAMSFSSRGYSRTVSSMDANQNIRVRNKRRKVRPSQIGLKRIIDMISPTVHVGGTFRPDCYNDVSPFASNKVSDGLRKLGPNKQDVIQFCHLSVAQFQELFLRGLAVPHALRLNDNTRLPGTISTSPLPYTTLSTSNNGTAYLDYVSNPNYDLLLMSYLTNYKITNQSNAQLCFELTEVCPKTYIYDSTHQFKSSSTTYYATPVRRSDPISCIKIDLTENDTNAALYNYDGTFNTGAPTSEVPLDNSSSLADRGCKIKSWQYRTFNHNYRVIKQTHYRIEPGNSLDYELTIAGFKRSSNFSYSKIDLQIGSGTDQNYVSIMPSVGPFSKYLIIRCWSPCVATAADADLGALSWASGSYSVVCSRSIKFKSLPKTKGQVDIIPEANGEGFVEFDDADGDQAETNQMDNIILGNQTIIDPDGNEVHIVKTEV